MSVLINNIFIDKLVNNTYLLINNTRTYIPIDVYVNKRDEQYTYLLINIIKRVERRINTC